jgi:PAN domain
MKRAQSQGRISVQVIVAIIGVVGVLGGAIFSNWKNIFGSSVDDNGDGGSGMGPLEMGVNRHGSDFSPNPEKVESPEACSRLCDSSAACKAMTFVRSPQGLPGGDCWLKIAVPEPTPRSDMISAVKIR